MSISAEWLMVIITAVYMIATIAICVFNGQSAKAASEQTAEMIRQYKESHRPVVVVKFEIASGTLFFTLENVGTMAALDVRFQVNDEFLTNIERTVPKTRFRSVTQSNIFLSVGQKMFILLGSKPQFSEIAKEKAIIDITYRSGGTQYHENAEIDLIQYGYYIDHSSELEDISSHLKGIKSDNEKFLAKISTGIRVKEPLLMVSKTENADVDKLFEVYKTVCINSGLTEGEIAEETGIEVNLVRNLLNELRIVYGFIGSNPSKDDWLDESKYTWFKKK